MVCDFEITSMDRGEVLRYMGYHGQGYDSSLDRRIEDAMACCMEISRPRCSCLVFDVARTETDEQGLPVVRLMGTSLALAGESISRHLEGAKAVGVMATTLGMSNERELKRLSLTDPLEQLLFDAASSALVERAADASEALLVAEATARGLFCNHRFSPGYGDLPMQTQPALLATLDAQRRLGITLTPSLLMTPTKSVTAVMGMFESPQPSSHASCTDCFCRDFCNLRASTGRTCHG